MTYQPNPLIPETVPVELTPVYRTTLVNEEICLYDGTLELVDKGKVLSGNGSIQLVWLPVPHFLFRMDASNWSPQPGALRFPTGPLTMSDGRSVDVYVTALKPGGGPNTPPLTISGEVSTTESGSGDPIATVTIHVPNFRSFMGANIRDDSGLSSRVVRAVMEGGGWRVTLDELRSDKASKGEGFAKQIEAVGGFGITHVGKIEQRTGETFSVSDARQIDDALFFFLSFCRGIWVAPLLAVGFDADGKPVWDEWREWKVERSRRVRSWFNSLSCTGLVDVFPGFHRRWQDETWNEPSRLAIHWYVESNMCAGGVEGGTILAQAAFELLAWTLLVEDRKVLSEEGFKKLPASDKLRLLLSACEIPLAIPESMRQLSKVASSENWGDGPRAITEIRNALVHANPKNRKKVLGGDSEARHEAWELSLWYLELVLLWVFDFRGDYSNRLFRHGCKGQEVEPVPWSVEGQ